MKTIAVTNQAEPGRVEAVVVPVPVATAKNLLQMLRDIAGGRRCSFGWWNGYTPQIECDRVDAMAKELGDIMDRPNAPAEARRSRSRQPDVGQEVTP